MDNVPVKIVERYKPPPIVYQLPSTIANKLATHEANFYNVSPQFAYDFQLERNVLSQVQCWRQMRQNEREARQQRQERRKQEQQRAKEAQQKKMLGAVEYPSADEFELSLSSTLEEENGQENEKSDARWGGSVANDDNDVERTYKTELPCDESHAAASERATSEIATKTLENTNEATSPKSINLTPANNFNNILQPTVLSQQLTSLNTSDDECSTNQTAKKHAYNVLFNYEDFEYDNSSIFDNIELKTINDLDILAQVLHQTQLTQQATAQTEEAEKKLTSDQCKVIKQIDEGQSPQPSEIKAGLNNVDFQNLARPCDESVVNNIPTNEINLMLSTNYNQQQAYQPHIYHQQEQQQQQQQQQQNFQQSHQIHTSQQVYHMRPQQQQQQQQQQQHSPITIMPAMAMTYATQYGYQPTTTQAMSTNLYNNQNYQLTQTYCNGHHQPLQQNTTQSSTMQPYGTPTHQISNVTPSTQFLVANSGDLSAESAALKSKSVPDILRELKTELLNSQQRRSRNHSHNLDDGLPVNTTKQATVTRVPTSSLAKSVYNELSAPARKLAERISTMGFPLERVSKVVRVCGIDDKKIIEHLIPLSELTDLGFEESKISAALLKFDNNKDKALEYLIS